jgi:predicted nucleic acid-binding protein
MRLKSIFPILPDTPALYPAWEDLVVQHQVIGKAAHDARLVAAIQVHNLGGILTFDKSGFGRYPGIEVLHPNDIAP